MVEDVDVSFRRQDFHHKAEFCQVEQKANEEHEDDGNVRCNGKHHCWLGLRRTLSEAVLFSAHHDIFLGVDKMIFPPVLLWHKPKKKH